MKCQYCIEGRVQITTGFKLDVSHSQTVHENEGRHDPWPAVGTASGHTLLWALGPQQCLHDIPCTSPLLHATAITRVVWSLDGSVLGALPWLPKSNAQRVVCTSIACNTAACCRASSAAT